MQTLDRYVSRDRWKVLNLGLTFCSPTSYFERHEGQGCSLGFLFSRAPHGIDIGEVDVTAG